MKRACLLAALLAILLPIGCGKKGMGLSGVYKSKDPATAAEWTTTFQDDGTFEGKSPTEVVKGTYTLEGRTLSMTVTEVNGEPAPFLFAQPATATLSDDGRSIVGENGIPHTKQE